MNEAKRKRIVYAVFCLAVLWGLYMQPWTRLQRDTPGTASPEFAADPWAIRYWFYAKTPYYDHRVGVYPVGLIDDPAVVAELPVE